MATELPVLSHKTALNEPDKFAEDLKHALLTTGFFYLDEIQFPNWRQLIDDSFEASQRFFDDVSPEAKERMAMINSRHFRGYSAFGVEVTAGKNDLREQIDLGPESEAVADYPPRADGQGIEYCLYGPNLWPDELPELRQHILELRERCRDIAYLILRTLGKILTPDPKRLLEPFEVRDERYPDYSRSKVVRYPPVKSFEPGSLGVGAHKDGGGITVLAVDQPGLQVQKWDGSWIDATPAPYSLVINIGQTIERLSAATFAATTHRVLPTTGDTPRLSIPFFLSPRLDATLDPLRPDELYPELRDVAEKRVEVSEVKKGDLHDARFGLMAWRGITRSHGEVWQKYYGAYDRIGGPEALRNSTNR